MNTYSNASNQYLTQRVLGANPGQMTVILLEGAQRFTVQASQAITRKDHEAKAHSINKTLAVLEELGLRIDTVHGGVLAQNLLGTYAWWGREIMDAGFKLDSSRLDKVTRQMAELRQTWEQSFQQRTGTPRASGPSIGELVG